MIHPLKMSPMIPSTLATVAASYHARAGSLLATGSFKSPFAGSGTMRGALLNDAGADALRR